MKTFQKRVLQIYLSQIKRFKVKMFNVVTRALEDTEINLSNEVERRSIIIKQMIEETCSPQPVSSSSEILKRTCSTDQMSY